MANYSSAFRVVLLKVKKEFLEGAKNAAIALRS
jgi:hypothetical protein